MRSVLFRLLPTAAVRASDRDLTYSGGVLVVRLGGALVAILLGAAGVALLRPDTWAGVIAGACLAWGAAMFIWAFSSYRNTRSQAEAELRHLAELALIHARLNQFAHRLGAPTLDLSGEIDAVTNARMERLAHYTGLDEFRRADNVDYSFWTDVALGRSLALDSNDQVSETDAADQ